MRRLPQGWICLLSPLALLLLWYPLTGHDVLFPASGMRGLGTVRQDNCQAVSVQGQGSLLYFFFVFDDVCFKQRHKAHLDVGLVPQI